MKTQYSDTDVIDYWDGNAVPWAKKYARGDDKFRAFFLDEAFAGFVGDVQGQKILDAGCGEGHSSRNLARQGAAVVGVDISPRMIEIAREHEKRDPLGIEYQEASMSDLSGFVDGAFDAVVSVMALMDTARYEQAVAEFFRVLRPGGTVLFSVLHPCFVATPGVTRAIIDGDKKLGLFIRNYWRQDSWLAKWDDKYAAPRFPYTLSIYLRTLITAGFVLTDIDEPRPSEDACRAFKQLAFWREHAAHSLFIRAEKRCGP
jgi:2-polyprenyl-3-methyl-5-hydroxy-6-metoxy-1,4-benzoquinol methylase